MLGKEALLLAQGKKEPMLSIPNGWRGATATIYFAADGTSMSMGELDTRFPSRKIPLSMLLPRGGDYGIPTPFCIEEGERPSGAPKPSLTNVEAMYIGGDEWHYYITNRTKDAEIRW